MVNSCIVYCYHRDAASSISLAVSRVTDLLTTTYWKIHLSNTVHFHFFVVQNIVMLYDSWQLSFCTVSRRDTEHQLNTSLQATPALSATLC